MYDYILNIAIPTFNRCGLLKNTLGIIIKEIKNNGFQKNICITVSDNASNDGTEEMIRDLQNNTDVNITYSKNIENLGWAKNIDKLIELSTAEYTWIFGDDDVLHKKGISKVMSVLQKENICYMFLNWESEGKKSLEIRDNFYGSFKDALLKFKQCASFITSNIFKTELLKNTAYKIDDWNIFERVLNLKQDINSCILSEPIITEMHENNKNHWLNQKYKKIKIIAWLLILLTTEENSNILLLRDELLNLYVNFLSNALNQDVNLINEQNITKKGKIKKYKKLFILFLIISIVLFVILFGVVLVFLLKLI